MCLATIVRFLVRALLLIFEAMFFFPSFSEFSDSYLVC
jgi:hypothetical protein